MSYSVEEIFKQVGKLEWEIEKREGSGFDDYQPKDNFNLAATTRDEFEKIILDKPCGSKFDVTYFMGIRPIWIASNNSLSLGFIAGSTPFDLARFLMVFNDVCSKEPKFEFSVQPLFGDDQRGTTQPIFDIERHSEPKPQGEAHTIALAVRSGSRGVRGMGIGH